MGIVYRIDQDRGTAFVLWDSVVTADEFLAHVRRLLSDTAWPPHGGRHLTDLRSAIVDTSIDDAVLTQAADLFGMHPAIVGLRAAIVAGDAFERAGRFERLIARHEPFVFVFNSLNPACTWLGIDAHDTARVLRSLQTESRRLVASGTADNRMSRVISHAADKAP